MHPAFARDWENCVIRPVEAGGYVDGGRGFCKRLSPHDRWSYFQVGQGGIGLETASRQSSLGPGQACLLPPQCAGRITASGDFSYFVMCFDVVGVHGRNPLLRLDLPTVVGLPEPQRSWQACAAIRAEAKELGASDPGVRLRMRHHLDGLLLEWLLSGFAAGLLSYAERKQPGWLPTALAWLDAHALDARLDLRTAAAIAGCSREHLIRTWRLHLGETPMARRDRLRLEWASRVLVDQPTLSIADLARRCRFSHATAFTRAFRRNFGLPPTAWRQRAA